MGSPLATLFVLCLYMLMITFGPKVMKNRPPFQLRLPMFVYNVAICALNAWIAGKFKKLLNKKLELIITMKEIFIIITNTARAIITS